MNVPLNWFFLSTPLKGLGLQDYVNTQAIQPKHLSAQCSLAWTWHWFSKCTGLAVICPLPSCLYGSFRSSVDLVFSLGKCWLLTASSTTAYLPWFCCHRDKCRKHLLSSETRGEVVPQGTAWANVYIGTEFLENSARETWTFTSLGLASNIYRFSITWWVVCKTKETWSKDGQVPGLLRETCDARLESQKT